VSSETLALLSVASVGASALVLLAGYRAIRSGNRIAHARRMVLAGVLAALFLIFYLVKAYLYGAKPYHGPEALRALYLGVLALHSLLAAVNLPLALFTFGLALFGHLDRHRRIAPWTLRVWLLVALTGWIVYGFLKL